MGHQVQWTAPAPFWNPAPRRDSFDEVEMRRPAILRFATDTFMEELIQVLATDPRRVVEFEAQYETWREPAGTPGSAAVAPRPSKARTLARLRVAGLRRAALVATATATAAPREQSELLKLYQPSHQRFYLTTACLVCRIPGLPDRALDPARDDRVTFVVRRLRRRIGSDGQPIIPAAFDEYAFVPGAGGGWVNVTSIADGLLVGEEQLPLFALNFKDDLGRRRRLLAGMIPVGKRDAYLGAGEAMATAVAGVASLQPSGDAIDPGAPAPPIDPRTALFVGQVSEPWKALIGRARKDREGLDESASEADANELKPTRKESRENIQVGSWYVLLDFVDFLQRHLPNVWGVLTGQPGAALETAAEQDLLTALQQTTLSNTLRNAIRDDIPAGRRPDSAGSLADALVSIVAFADGLDEVTGAYVSDDPAAGWPTFIFPLADPLHEPPLPPIALQPAPPNEHAGRLRKISGLVRLVSAALPAVPAAPVPPTPIAAQPVMAPSERGLFVTRCVYERPECAPFEPTIVSEPSRVFELAGFFDPDAPARPIRIALPIDTTPAGLRKFDRNTAFMMSDVLCGQIARAKGLGFVDLVRSVLPFPFHKDLSVPDTGPCKSDGLELGMICTLSIPIITICALILLMIIITLLDIVFRWMPFFMFCFPLPGFKAKGRTA